MKQRWVITVLRERHLSDGTVERIHFTETSDKHPALYLSGNRRAQPGCGWYLLFAMPITAAQSKQLDEA